MSRNSSKFNTDIKDGIVLVGDVAFTGIISTQPELNKARYKKIIPLLNSGEAVFANLEVPLMSGNERNDFKNSVHFSYEEPTKVLLQRFNITCVSLANNHIYDFKMNGLKATINMLDSIGVRHTGAGWKKEQLDPIIVETKDTTIAFMAYVDSSTNPKTENYKDLFVNYLIPDNIIEDIKRIKDKVDKVILSLHWGTDYSFYPEPEQRRLAKLFVEAGADIIMGHHPHTLQPYETIKGASVFYSLGGLTFGDYVKEGKSEIQSLFRKTKKGVILLTNRDLSVRGCVSTLEKKGNYISLPRKSYLSWSKKMWHLYRFKHSSSSVKRFFVFKERILDRVVEYFFGYYKNPVKRLFQFKNIKKIKKLV